EFRSSLSWNNQIGIGLVTFWLALLFLMIVGFGYSYFWTATTIIYLLLRQKVDDTDFDEIHLEEEDADLPFMPDRPPSAAASTSPPGVTFTMVDAPQLRPATTPQMPVVDQSSPEGPTSSGNPV